MIYFCTNWLYDYTFTGHNIPDLSDLDYPIPPNGVRRFLVSFRIIFRGGGDYENARRVYADMWSGGTRYIQLFSPNATPPLNGQIYILAADGLQVTPAAGHQVTIRVHETNGASQSDIVPTATDGLLNADQNQTYRNSNLSDRGRCYVGIEYLDEG